MSPTARPLFWGENMLWGKRVCKMAAAKGTRIRHPEDIYAVVKSWARRREENFLTITLNGAHEVIKVHHITKGLVNMTIAHPRECYYPVVKDYASAVAFVHNHPSGSLTPSREDEELTERLCMAGNILGFNVIDHIIIGSKGGFYSFRKEFKLREDFSQTEKAEFVNYLAAERN
jgi:DNA repair protein RadC